MAGDRVIQVPLPDGAEPTHEDLELLQGIFAAIVALRFRADCKCEEIAQALTVDGWNVRSRLMWVAEARRRSESELATGRSRTDAFENLRRLVRAEQVISAL